MPSLSHLCSRWPIWTRSCVRGEEPKPKPKRKEVR
ncbi:hypothetical protein MUK42_10504 [Musa troglodytarum]|uniref:Uncharacterized protein n=1 Tax=Musa troglodytarum TaxID=320322 RepID=A0A9E7GJS8_9LILI|nr:hypothetical protein MUK42_10504 [Musa troglodytarum]